MASKSKKDGLSGHHRPLPHDQRCRGRAGGSRAARGSRCRCVVAGSFGSPLMVDVGALLYPVMNTLLDAGYPDGALNYWLSSFTRGLPDGLIETAVERHRARGWNRLIPSVWTDPRRPAPTSAGPARRSPLCSPASRPAAGSTTSATTRPTTRSRPPTAPTTGGCATSSAATTRRRLPPQPQHHAVSGSRTRPLGGRQPGRGGHSRSRIA